MTGKTAYVSQIDYWNGPAGDRWVREQSRLDRVFAPLHTAVLERAAVRSGERVIDVGCGCGASVLELAARVGPTGAVLGVDVSERMLERARERASAHANVELRLADAATNDFGATHDLIFSRFGVMFFDEPVAAFANLRRALRSGGRLCVMCWRTPDENPWYVVPLRAAETVLPPVQQPAPGAAGPFAFGQAERLRSTLASAGFRDIALEAVDAPLTISQTGLDEAADFSVLAGPVARMLVDVAGDRAALARTRAAIRAALTPYAQGETVTLSAATWIATATG